MTVPNDDTIHIMKYMGSKRPLLDFIVPIVAEHCESGGTILDLFAGVHSVSYALRPKYRVFTNDIQQYSLVIGRAIIENTEACKQSYDVIWDQLKEPYQKNLSALNEHLSESVQKESEVLDNYATIHDKPLLDEYNMAQILDDYQSLIRSYPLYSSQECFSGKRNTDPDPELVNLFTSWITERKQDAQTFPYALFSMYYSNSYFGITQCVTIDSLRYAIDVAFPKDDDSLESRSLRNICLSAMMYAASYCVAAPGHFAQYIRFNPNKKSGYQAIFHHRLQSFLHKFQDKIDDIYQALEPAPYENRCYCKDYRLLLQEEEILNSVDLVYADPPYTSVHYSRFYHILETLVKYDYPASNYVGKYRDDRHQSGFCQKSNVKKEFRNLLETLSKMNKTLIISYPNTGLISLSKLVELCRTYYARPQSVITGNHKSHTHSTMGGEAGDATRNVTEALIVCTNPQK